MPDARSQDFLHDTEVICRSFIMASRNSAAHDVAISSSISTGQDGNDIAKHLLSLVEEFDRRFSNQYEDGLSTKELVFELEASTNQAYYDVLDCLFEAPNWGRVVAMFSLMKTLLADSPNKSYDDYLIASTSVYCNNCLQNWISSHGGWSGLLEFRNRMNSDSNFAGFSGFKSIFVRSIGALGFVAALGFLAARF